MHASTSSSASSPKCNVLHQLLAACTSVTDRLTKTRLQRACGAGVAAPLPAATSSRATSHRSFSLQLEHVCACSLPAELTATAGSGDEPAPLAGASSDRPSAVFSPPADLGEACVVLCCVQDGTSGGVEPFSLHSEAKGHPNETSSCFHGWQSQPSKIRGQDVNALLLQSGIIQLLGQHPAPIPAHFQVRLAEHEGHYHIQWDMTCWPAARWHQPLALLLHPASSPGRGTRRGSRTCSSGMGWQQLGCSHLLHAYWQWDS